VDCCAFLAWRLAGKAVGIHSRTQDFNLRLPEEGDIYTILKYLADRVAGEVRGCGVGERAGDWAGGVGGRANAQ
jgi:hypothetical protein